MSNAVLLEIVMIPVFAFLGILIGKQMAKRKVRRMQAYRASTESHLLNLRG